jgi:hypothetical protein
MQTPHGELYKRNGGSKDAISRDLVELLDGPSFHCLIDRLMSWRVIHHVFLPFVALT